MIILLPNTSQQTINILPRVNSIDGVINMNLRRDGDGVSESITDAVVSKSGDFISMTFNSTILQEDSTYYLEITRDGKLWYRDKIYSTEQKVVDVDLDKPHVIGNNTIYKSYDKTDDNTYII